MITMAAKRVPILRSPVTLGATFGAALAKTLLQSYSGHYENLAHCKENIKKQIATQAPVK